MHLSSVFFQTSDYEISLHGVFKTASAFRFACLLFWGVLKGDSVHAQLNKKRDGMHSVHLDRVLRTEHCLGVGCRALFCLCFCSRQTEEGPAGRTCAQLIKPDPCARNSAVFLSLEVLPTGPQRRGLPPGEGVSPKYLTSGEQFPRVWMWNSSIQVGVQSSPCLERRWDARFPLSWLLVGAPGGNQSPAPASNWGNSGCHLFSAACYFQNNPEEFQSLWNDQRKFSSSETNHCVIIIVILNPQLMSLAWKPGSVWNCTLRFGLWPGHF